MLLFIIGYVLAVIFPIYGLNAVIVNLWTKFGSYLKGATTSNAPVAASAGVTSPVVAPKPTTQHVNRGGTAF